MHSSEQRLQIVLVGFDGATQHTQGISVFRAQTIDCQSLLCTSSNHFSEFWCRRIAYAHKLMSASDQSKERKKAHRSQCWQRANSPHSK
jgi:hypothetical protein